MDSKTFKALEKTAGFWDEGLKGAWMWLTGDDNTGRHDIDEKDIQRYALQRKEVRKSENPKKYEAWKNGGAWRESVQRLTDDPDRAMTSEGADDVRNVVDAFNNPTAMAVADTAHMVDRHRYLSGLKNTSADTTELTVSDYDKAHPAPSVRKKQLQPLLEPLVRYAESQPGDYADNYGKAASGFGKALSAAEYVEDAGEDYGKLLSDDGYAHLKNLQAIANDDARMKTLREMSPESYKKLVDKRNMLNFAVNNRSSLQDLWAFKQNPLMWLIRSIFSRDPRRFYGAIRNLHTAFTDKNSDWYKYLGGAKLSDYAGYMPWLRLAHNVRGTVGGDANFKPITYNG